jgi:hypothetical protein
LNALPEHPAGHDSGGALLQQHDRVTGDVTERSGTGTANLRYVGSNPTANSRNGASPANVNGAFEAEIGARDREIGAPSVRLTLTDSLTEKSAAPPSPAIAGSAAQQPETDEERNQERLKAKAWSLLRDGKSDEQIVAELRGVTETQVAAWRRLREAMPLLPAGRRRRAETPT